MSEEERLKNKVRELGESLGVPMDGVLDALDGALLGRAMAEADRYCKSVEGQDLDGDPKPADLLMQVELEDGSWCPVLEIEADGGYITFKPKHPLRKA